MRKQRILAVLLIAGVLSSLGLTGCGSNAPASSAAQTTPTADRSTVGDVVSAEGIVEPYRQAELNFQAVGRITDILVVEGDQVTQGQELAHMDTLDLSIVVKKAEAGLKSAQASLAKAKAGARVEEVATAESQAAIAVAGVKAAEAAVKVAEGSLTSSQADLSSVESGILVADGGLAAAQGALGSAQAALNKAKAGPTALDIQIAEKNVERAKNELYGYQRQRDASYNIVDGAIAAAENGVEIAQLQLDQLKVGTRPEDIAAAEAQVIQAAAGVKTATGQQAQAKARLEQAKAAVQIAQSQLAQSQAQVDSAKAQASQAQAQLELIKAGTRVEDVAVAEAGVAQAQAAVDEAKSALDNAILRAPFGGTIGAVLANEGELASSQRSVISLGDLAKLRVRTEDLGEVDIHSIKLGQAATVTMDALEGKRFQGKVSRISPLASDRRGDKVYTVTIDVEQGIEAGLRWGMSAFIEINVQ